MTISAINLGNTFTNANGTSVASGLSSGLNTSSIIDQIVSAQTSQVTTLKDQVTVDNNQTTALNTLQQDLTSLQSAASLLANPQSPDSTTNLFAVRTSNITSNTNQAASNYLSASVSSAATAGNYVISNISSLATATIQETNAFSIANADTSVVDSSPTNGYFTAGSFTVNGQTITLTAGETLNQIASAFNTANSGSSPTGIGASVLQTSAGNYKLILTGQTGLANSFDLSTNSASTTTGGALNKVTFATDQHAADASFNLNGVAIDRATNNISDLISGVTVNLLQDTTTQANASFTINIAPDTNSISQGITAFTNAYNNFLTFYAQQTQFDSTTGAPATGAVLYSDTTLKNIYNTLTSQVNKLVGGLGLADVGVSFADTPATSTTPDVPNTLSVDSATLTNALTNNFANVEKVFGYNATSSSADLSIYQGPNDGTISHFTINVSQSTGTYTAQYTDASGNPQTVDLTESALGSTGGAISLTAPTTSGLNGLTLIYTGSGDETGITVSTTNGIANLISSFATTATTANTGLIATDQQAIATKVTTTQTQITNINTQITNTRQSLLTKFSSLEAAITAANASLNYLNAQQLAASSSG